MRRFVLLALTLAACTGAKIDPTDDFSGVGDEKSDSFSKKMKLVSKIDVPVDGVSVPYTASPIYRALKLTAQTGDVVKVTVNTWSGKINNGGDPVTWLLDASFKVLAKNDDVTASMTDSQLVATLRASKGGVYYIVVRDYNYADTTFTVNVGTAVTTGNLVADANQLFAFYITDDNYGVIAPRYELKTKLLKTIASQRGAYDQQGYTTTAYKLPYRGGDMFILTATAEETYLADAYDGAGNLIAHAEGQDAVDISFAPPVVHHGTASVSDFQQYYKCPDDADTLVLGDKGSKSACLAACEKESAVGCWYLDGTGGFARDCRICRTMTPTKQTWANDWALTLK